MTGFFGRYGSSGFFREVKVEGKVPRKSSFNRYRGDAPGRRPLFSISKAAHHPRRMVTKGLATNRRILGQGYLRLAAP
jgi:hypothetical protein